MNFNLMQWFDPNILIFMGFSFFLNGFIAYLWYKKFYRKLGLKTYKAIQRIHLNETPRLGGLVFILSLLSYVIYCNTNESIQLLKFLLICLIPIIVVGFKEDVFHNVSPFVRLLSLIFVGWLFRFNYTYPLPNLTDVPFIGKLILLQGGVSFFYIFSMVSIANGMNLIDGVNGLCGAAVLSILCSLLFLSYKTNDIVMLTVIFSLILLFLPFMFINYPYGHIFLGDLGSYSLGLISSMISIILFGRHPEVSPWVAVLILIYPATEVVFSILRRFFCGTKIYSPDKDHLHLKVHIRLRSSLVYKKVANPLVTLILMGFWVFPVVSVPWVYQKPLFVYFAITLFLFCYIFIYLYFLFEKKHFL